MSEFGETLITHYRPSTRSVATLPLAEIEPFVRALAVLDGDEDRAWEAFQRSAQFWIAEEGTAFLPSVINEGFFSNYFVFADTDETPQNGGEGLIHVQRILRQLKIPRLEDFETKRLGEAFDMFCLRLCQHGYACYQIATDSPEVLVHVVKNATQFEEVANAAGIEVAQWEERDSAAIPTDSADPVRGYESDAPSTAEPALNTLIPRSDHPEILTLLEGANARADRRRRKVVDEQRYDLGGRLAENLFRAATFGYAAGVDLETLRNQMRESVRMAVRGGSFLTDSKCVGLLRLLGLHEELALVRHGLRPSALAGGGLRSHLLTGDRPWLADPPGYPAHVWHREECEFADQVVSEPARAPLVTAEFLRAWVDERRTDHNLMAYEVAALAQMHGVDDSALANHPSYPYELVHAQNPSSTQAPQPER